MLTTSTVTARYFFVKWRLHKRWAFCRNLKMFPVKTVWILNFLQSVQEKFTGSIFI
jgi:hypothetical protein